MNRFLPRILGITLAALAIAAGAGAQDRAPLLVTPAWLAQHLHDANLALLEIGDKKSYDASHIPGAQFISLQDISTPQGQGLDLEMPAADVLQQAFESRGISYNSHVIVYFSQASVSPATRVLFTLAYVGLDGQISLLDGGFPAWKAAGNPVSSAAETAKPGKLAVHLHPEMIVDAQWIAAHMRQPSLALIDARQADAYNSTAETNPMRDGMRPGHIPGAQNLPIESLLGDAAKLKDQPAIADLFHQAGAANEKQLVAYCWIGQRATLVWFTAKLLGFNAQLYDGSWQDWSARKDLPVETGPAHQ